jgi:hypothetical protein
MTRGTAILLTNFKSVTTCEFNGEMYIEPDSNGSILLKHLERVKSTKGFKREVTEFNKKCFGYIDIPIYLVVKRLRNIEFKPSTYYRDWFSDYLYFLNISWFKIKIIDMDGKVFYLLPGEIAVFYFGKFYMSHNYHAKVYAEIPIRQLKPIPAK